MSKVVALVPAPGVSRTVQVDCGAALAGKPLVAWTIEAAQAARCVERVIVATDDTALAETARAHGAEAPFLLPAELAGDRSSHVPVVEHALGWLESQAGRLPEFLLVLPPTSPLRSSADIDRASALAGEMDLDSVVSVVQTNDHPYLAKQLTREGWLVDFVSINLACPRRQDFPPAYMINDALYLTRTRAFRNFRTFLSPRTCGSVMPAERSLRIQEPWDLHLARLILEDEARQRLRAAA